MTISLLSLDGRDTDRSKHVLLVALGWCGNLGMKFEKQDDGSRILSDAGHGPVSIDTLEGSMKAPGWTMVYPLNPDGSRNSPLAGYDAFRYGQESTMFYELEAR